MKYSLRSLMVVALIGPAAIGTVAWLLLPRRDPAWWTWSKEKSSLDYCIKEYLPDYEVEHVVEDEFLKNFYTRINIRDKKDGKVLYTRKEGYDTTVFTRSNDNLYIAENSPSRTGCDVVAVDLKTGKQLWKSQLQGIGPTTHSKYTNLVNIDTDGRKVIVWGNESSGRYVEILDLQTGKTLTNKRLDADPKSLIGQ